jgi:hypothetical protein
MTQPRQISGCIQTARMKNRKVQVSRFQDCLQRGVPPILYTAQQSPPSLSTREFHMRDHGSSRLPHLRD